MEKKISSHFTIGNSKIDYKNIDLLKKFLSLEGKIIARRKSGLSALKHRNISKSIKRARAINLLPFINKEH